MQQKIKAYLQVSKMRISTLVLVTTALGYFLANRGSIEPYVFCMSLLGTLISCCGAAALNIYLERDVDGKMVRTRNRPIQTGRLSANETLLFGIISVLAGVSLLASEVNLLTAFLALLTSFLYVLVYTPLKRVTWLNTTIGAIPGALPPMGGWAAATGSLDWGAWSLFLIMFIWQHPHFFSIAWMYRDDYGQAGFKMLPSIEPEGKLTFRLIIAGCAILIPVSVLPTVFGLSGTIYFVGAVACSIAMLLVGIMFSRNRTRQNARRLLHATLLYLPALFVLILSDTKF